MRRQSNGAHPGQPLLFTDGAHVAVDADRGARIPFGATDTEKGGGGQNRTSEARSCGLIVEPIALPGADVVPAPSGRPSAR